ncbi:MAG: methyltransferase regulatory domain-containing protein [Thiotrichaceae bacterium]
MNIYTPRMNRCTFINLLHESKTQGFRLSRRRIFSHHVAVLPSTTARPVYEFKDNILQQEQMMDFLRNRAMRHTLLCHPGIPTLNRTPGGWVSQFCYRSPLQFAGVEANNHTFENRKAKLVSENPLIQATFHYLGGQYPRAVPFEELITQVAQLCGPNLRMLINIPLAMRYCAVIRKALLNGTFPHRP